jgi:phosphomannomutase
MKQMKNLLLFDIDGTLTKPRLKYDQEIISVLKEAKKHFDIGIVGGSDRVKQIEQLEEHINLFNYCFSENGTVSYHEGKLFHENSIANYFGEENFQRLINFILKVLSETKIPKKRGNFIEYRNGVLNVSPIGRNCSQKEREEFEVYNKEHHILPTVREKILAEFEKEGVYVSIGGQISMDIFPMGWDKTYCLQFVDHLYQDIHFFGDKCFKGGNDIEIYEHKRVIGHSVDGPHDTAKIVRELLNKIKD